MFDDLKDFYQKEYDTLSQAHFQAAERITTFFQYALAILAAPIAIFELSSKVTQPATQPTIDRPVINIICLAISLVGFFIVLYLGQLRTEVLMYARCINTIRKFFYENSLKVSDKNSITHFMNEYSVLLVQKRKPKFWDGEQFIFIILSLGTINTLYLGYSLYDILKNNFLISFILSVLYLALHFISYLILTRLSEANTRFYKHNIGLDIDGVLNMHKEQFVSIYNELIDNGKIDANKISIADIKTIPVQDAGEIKENDAKKVFLTAKYWSSMQANNGAARVINETLINKMGYKVHIFTSRDWNPTKDNNKPYKIRKKTKEWLKKNNIKFDKIHFEKGNFDKPISIRTALYKNRFYLSAKRKIEFFIEDEPIKARKLANTCRYVFLIDHLYNQEDTNRPFPSNVIRVTNWDEIEKKIIELI